MSKRTTTLLQRVHIRTVTLVFFACVFSETMANDTFELPTPVRSYRQGSLTVSEYGAGARTLILIPGLVSGPWVWAETVNALAAKHRIVAITLSGFDGVPASSGESLMSTALADLDALIREQKLNKPVLVGHSLGGTLSIAFATMHAEAIGGVIAIDGLPVFPPTLAARVEERDELAAQAAKSFRDGCSTMLACQRQYMTTMGTTDEQLAEELAQRAARSDTKAASAWLEEIMRADFRAQLSRATVPILEIVPFNQADARPPLTSASAKERAYATLLAQAPDARTVVIEDARHFAMLDQPEAWLRELLAFLKRIPAK